MTNRKEDSSSYLDAVNFVFFILKWWKPLVVVTIAAITLSSIFSGPSFIKPKYKSSVIFFPGTTNSISKALLGENPADKDILAFGDEAEAEQLLQILNSDDIRDRISAKYDLMKHYGIEPGSRYPLTQLYREYEGNISYERTEYMSVKITVYDTEPQLAADIANDIAALLDSMKTKIQRERAEEGLKIVESEYFAKTRSIQEMEDSLKKIRERGIFDYEVQSKILNEEYSKASSLFNNETERLKSVEQYTDTKDTAVIGLKGRISAVKENLKEIESNLKLLSELGGANISLTQNLELERRQLSLLKEKYDKARVDARQVIPHKFIVNHAVKAEKKSYPIRWLIVLITTVSTFLLSVIFIIFIEYLRRKNNPFPIN